MNIRLNSVALRQEILSGKRVVNENQLNVDANSSTQSNSDSNNVAENNCVKNANNVSTTDIYLAKQDTLNSVDAVLKNDPTLTRDGYRFISSKLNSLVENFAANYLEKHPNDISSMCKDFLKEYCPNNDCETILAALTVKPVMTKGNGEDENMAVTIQSGNTQNVNCAFGIGVTITQYMVAKVGASTGDGASDTTYSLDPASGMLTVNAGGKEGTIYLTIVGLGIDGKAYTKEVAIIIQNNKNGKAIEESDTIKQKQKANETNPYGNYSDNNWTQDIKDAQIKAKNTLQNYLNEIKTSLLAEGYSQTALATAVEKTFDYYSNIINGMTDQVNAKHRLGKNVKTDNGASYTQITRYDEDKMFDGKKRKDLLTTDTGLYLLEDKNLFRKNNYQIVFTKDIILDKFINEYRKAGGSNGAVHEGIEG